MYKFSDFHPAESGPPLDDLQCGYAGFSVAVILYAWWSLAYRMAGMVLRHIPVCKKGVSINWMNLCKLRYAVITVLH